MGELTTTHHKREALTFHHTPHTITQSHKKREGTPHTSHNHKKLQLTVVRPTEEEPTEVKLTLQATVREPTLQLQPMVRRPTLQLMEVKLTEEELTLHHMERKLTLQLQLTEVKLTEEELTLHYTERKLTPQPTEVKLTEDVLTLHRTERRLTPQLQLTEVKPTVETLTEVKLTEEEPTEVNNTVTRRGAQFDYFAELFKDHQTSQMKFKTENFFLFIFICVF